MIRKPAANEFYNTKFKRTNVNIDSIERASGTTGEYKVKLQQRLLKVKAVRLCSAEIPNTIYCVTEPGQFVEIKGLVDTLDFYPFNSKGNFTPAVFGFGNKNIGFSQRFADGAGFTNIKWRYNPATMKLNLYSDHVLTITCYDDNLSRILGMKKNEPYTSQNMLVSTQSSYIVTDLNNISSDLNPYHPKFSYIQAYTGKYGLLPPDFASTETALYYRIELPYSVNFNPTPYVYLTIKEFEPYYDKYSVAAPTDPIGNGNLGKIPLTSELGRYVFFQTFRRIDTTEFFTCPDSYFDIDTLTVCWYDAFGNVVDFNGVDHSFVLEILQDLNS